MFVLSPFLHHLLNASSLNFVLSSLCVLFLLVESYCFFKHKMNNLEPEHTKKEGPAIESEVMVMKEDTGSVPCSDSQEAPPNINIVKDNAGSQQELHEGIILLITTDTGSQRSLTGSPNNFSEYYLLPVSSETLTAHRRHSLRDQSDKNHHHQHQERKASCPDTGLHISPIESRRNSSCSRNSELDTNKDRLTPSSFSSRRASNASACHSRRSSNCSIAGVHRKNRSRRSSVSSVSHSRRSSSPSHKSSSNCSRRSSHVDSDDDSILHHHHHHRGSRTSLDPLHPGSVAFVDINGVGRDSILHSYQGKHSPTESAELEVNGIPQRHRKIIIMAIGSISIFILVMAVVLIAVSLSLSPTIDDLVIQREKERELINKVCCMEQVLNSTEI